MVIITLILLAAAITVNSVHIVLLSRKVAARVKQLETRTRQLEAHTKRLDSIHPTVEEL